MSGKALKRSSYWLRERNKKTTDVKNSELEELCTIEHLRKHGIRLENCRNPGYKINDFPRGSL